MSLQFQVNNYQMLRQTSVIYFLLALFSMFLGVQTLSWTANEKYSYSGKCIVDMNSLISQQGTTDLYPATVTVTLPRYYSKVFRLQVATSLGDFEADNLNQGIDIIFFPTNIAGMSFDIQIYTLSARNILKLSINYLISDFPFNDPNARLFFIRFHSTQLTNDPLFDYIAYYTISELNITGGARQASLISGLKILPSSMSFVCNFAINIQIKNETYIMVQLTSSSEEFTLLQNLIITVLLYNEGYMTQQSIYYRLYDDSFVVSNSSFVSYQSYIREIANCNTIIGISALALSNTNKFNILSDIGQSNNIEINSDYVMEYLKISFISVYSQYCDYKTPYYESTTGVCYSTCPQKTQNQQKQLTCVCYVQDGFTLIASNNCSSMANNLSSQAESSSNTLILSLIIGSIAFLVATIRGIYCCRKKLLRENLYQINDNNHIQLRAQVSFDSSPSKQTLAVIKSNENKQVQPKFYRSFQPQADQISTKKQSSSKIKKQFQKKQHEQQIRLPQAEQSIQKVQWTDCSDKYNSQERCYICIKMNAFLKTKCSHYFHAKCMLDYLQKQFHVCPQCQQTLYKYSEYYCVSCFKRYRQINLDSLKKEIIKLDQLQTKCQQCREIPK